MEMINRLDKAYSEIELVLKVGDTVTQLSGC